MGMYEESFIDPYKWAAELCKQEAIHRYPSTASKFIRYSDRFYGSSRRDWDINFIREKIVVSSRYTHQHAFGKLRHLKSLFETEQEIHLFLKSVFSFGENEVTGRALQNALFEDFNLTKEDKKMSNEKSNTPNLFNLALTMIPEMKFYGVVADFQKQMQSALDPDPKAYTYCSLLNLSVGDKVLVLMGGKLAKAEIAEIQKETAIDVFAAFKYGMIESTIDCRPALDAEKAANSVIEILENARREQATRSAKQLILNQLGLDQTTFSIENLTGDNHAED